MKFFSQCVIFKALANERLEFDYIHIHTRLGLGGGSIDSHGLYGYWR